MEDDDIPIRILDEADVADAAVFDADDLTTRCTTFISRDDAERFVEERRKEEPELANSLRIEEHELSRAA